MLWDWLRGLFRSGPPAIRPDALIADFLRAARARGLPRGLIWKRLEIQGDPRIANDLLLVQLLAYFEPVPGSDMESIPAAREPRPIVGIFELHRGRWQPRVPPVFNHTVDQVAANLQGK